MSRVSSRPTRVYGAIGRLWLAFAVLAGIGTWAATTPRVHYLAGRFNVGMGWSVWLVTLGSGAAIFGFVVVLAFEWQRLRPALRVLGVLLPAAGLAAYAGFHRTGPAPYISYTEGFAVYIDTKADVEAIRAWAKSLPRPGGPHGRFEISSSSWPPAVRELSPRTVVTWPRSAWGVHLAWGVGFGHWGVAVGPKTRTLPGPVDGSHYARVAHGAYVWYER